MGSRIQQANHDQSVASATLTDRHNASQPIAEIQVAPHGQQNLSLGSFTPASPPSGFAVEPGTESSPVGAITTELISQGTTNHYELVLHIANTGTKTERVKVWAM